MCIFNRLAKRVESAATAAEAIVQAGLDWTVSKQQLFRLASGVKVVSKSVSLVRDDVDHELAVVGGGYAPLQNGVAFDVLNPLIEAGLIQIKNAGMISEGVRTFLLAEVVGATAMVAGEPVDLFILCTNSHGYGAVNFGFVPIIRSTGQTLAGVGGSVKLTHRGNIERKVKSLANAMDLAKGRFVASVDAMNEMQQIGMTSESFKELVKTVVESKNANATGARKLEKVLRHGANVNNVLDAYMALASYFNSRDAGRNDNSILTSLWYGQGKNQLKSAFEKCVQLVKEVNDVAA